MWHARFRGYRITDLASLAAALLLALLAGCSDAGGPTGPSSGIATEVPLSAQVVSFDVVTEITTPVSGILDVRRIVISETDAWEALWAEFGASIVPLPPAPEIDFDQNMAIVATIGERRSGGYSASVPEVARDGEVLYVVVEEGIPGIECITTDQVTSPAVAVIVPRVEDEVRFVEREISYPCAPGS